MTFSVSSASQFSPPFFSFFASKVPSSLSPLSPWSRTALVAIPLIVILGALIYRICSITSSKPGEPISSKPSEPISVVDQIELVNKVFCKFISQLRELDNSTTERELGNSTPKRRAIWSDKKISKTAHELIKLTGELAQLDLDKKYSRYYTSLYLCIRLGCYYSLHPSENKIIFEKRNISGETASPSIPETHDKPYYAKGNPQFDLRLNYNKFLDRVNSDIRDTSADTWDRPLGFDAYKPIYRTPMKYEFTLIPNPLAGSKA